MSSEMDATDAIIERIKATDDEAPVRRIEPAKFRHCGASLFNRDKTP